MSKQSLLNPDSREEQDAHYDPAQRRYDEEFKKITQGQGERDEFDNMVNNDPELAKLRDNEDNAKAPKDVDDSLEDTQDREAASTSGGSGDTLSIPYSPSGTPQKKEGFIKRARKNRKNLVALGIVGGLLSFVVGGFFALVPMKLQMLIQTATENAAEIPENLIEQRMEYLTELYIVNQILGYSLDSPDTALTGTIAGSLFTTWRAGNYETKLGIKIESTNRDWAGDNATKWRVTKVNSGTVLAQGGNAGDAAGITREINGSKEMRRYVREETKNATRWEQFYKRYAMRKTLYKTKGVTKWAWLSEPAVDKIDNFTERKTALKRSIKNQLNDGAKKIGARSALYMACLTEGVSACRDMRDIRANAPPEGQPTTCEEGDSACEQRRDAAEDVDQAAQDVQNDIVADADASLDQQGDQASKFLTKQMIAKLAGGIGIADIVFRIVDGVENGSVAQIIYDRNSIATVDFASKFLSYQDQMEAGKMTSEQWNVAMETLGDYGGSPAWQQEAGLIDTTAKVYERKCGPEAEVTKLDPGETVCPERKVITNPTQFTDKPWWEALADVAAAWLSTIGQIFNFINWVLETTGIADILSSIVETVLAATGLGDVIANVLGSLLEAVFGAPVNGNDTNEEAGDNVLAGIKSSYFAMGEAGAGLDANNEPDGTGMGLGGEVMTPTATRELKAQIAAQKAEQFKQKSLFAKVFDTSSTQSLASQLILRTPTSGAEFALLPSIFKTSLASVISPQTFAQVPQKDQFGFDFSYGHSAAALKADPSQYTEEACAEMEKQRRDSYQYVEGSGMPIMVYTKANPCALEIMVGSIGSAMFTDEEDPNFQLVSDEAPAGAPATGGVGSVPTGTTQELAQQILNNPNISFQVEPTQRNYMQRIADTGTAATCGSPPISPKLLGVLLALAEKYQFVIGVMVDGHVCDGGYHPKGLGVDLNGIKTLDGSQMVGTGRNIRPGDYSSDNALLKAAYVDISALVAAAGGGAMAQRPCFSNPPPIESLNGVRLYGGDGCNHIHLEVEE